MAGADGGAGAMSSAPECAEFDTYTSRADAYTLAHKDNPGAREAELRETLNMLGDLKEKTIIEIGAGQGFLTAALLENAGSGGRVIAVDASARQLSALQESFPRAQCIQASSEDIPLAAETADMIVSLANFHHIELKERAFQECARLLKPNGILAIVDVSDNTPVQRYFDEVIATICSTGHPHTFLNRSLCEAHCDASGLQLRSWQLKTVPWEFVSEQAGGLFVQRIHDALCTPEGCWKSASTYLGASYSTQGKIQLQWQLFFMLAQKASAAN